MDTLDIAQFLGLAGAGALINVIVEAVKRFARWSQEETERVAPLFSIALGVLIFLLYSLTSPVEGITTGQAVVQAFVTGIIAGGTSAGIYQLGGKAVIRQVAGPVPLTPADLDA